MRRDSSHILFSQNKSWNSTTEETYRFRGSLTMLEILRESSTSNPLRVAGKTRG